MTVTAGSHIGPYEVMAPLGAGAMGEVYRARDARLGREVALKLLPEALSVSAARRARFEREARVLASLNHPNIATLHGVEDWSGGEVLVMELVEGDTLADRLALNSSRGLPLRDALEVARQLAAALEAAHEQGILHRDLKPANIIVRPDGTVKVLDFGLAKLVDPRSSADGSSEIGATATDVQAPGAGPGTPAYMSPEQARGDAIDKRADIWAFGCVLYELLTGQRPFGGERTSDVVAKILETEPDFTRLPSDTPAAVRRLLRRCLEKHPRKRLRDVGDARLEIDDSLGSEPEVALPPTRGRWRGLFAAAAAAALVTGGAAWLLVPRQPNVSQPVTRFSITAQTDDIVGGRSLAISPDGSRLVYLSEHGITVRSRDRLDGAGMTVPIDSPRAPFFSPDGQWIGYTDGQTLFKVAAVGGPAVFMANVGEAALASWNADGIVLADVRGLFRMAQEGAAPEPLPNPALGPMEQAAYPELLPGGRAVLFTVLPARTIIVNWSEGMAGARIDVLNLATGTRKTLLRGAARAHYMPTGHLVYVAGQSLYDAPFDSEHLELRGEPVQIVSDVSYGEFAASDEGTLVYMSGGGQSLSTVVSVDRQGREEALGTPPRPYRYPRLAPDGNEIALDVGGPNRDIWIWDLRRRALERFTVDPAGNPLAAWSPDGRQIAFGSDRFGPTQIYLQRADRSSDPERLLESDRLQMPLSFVPDGRLLFSEEVPQHGRDIRMLWVDDRRRVETLVHSPGNDANAEVSPDSRWLAYDSDESGQFEVYVRPFPDVDRARWQVSIGGGRQPLWSRDGRELFYRDFSGALLSVAIASSPVFRAGSPRKILDGSGYAGSGRFMSGRTYDVSLDGRRFLMLKYLPSEPRKLVAVLNWTRSAHPSPPSR